MFQIIGLASVIYATIFFTISFFVLLIVRKLEEGGFRYFGLAVVGMLWLSAALILSTGAQALSSQRSMMLRNAKIYRQQMMQRNIPVMPKAQQLMPKAQQQPEAKTK